MEHYYVNTGKDKDGHNEVHTESCDFLPSVLNREYLGYYSNCKDAVEKAKSNGYKEADGCIHCSRDCHTG